MRKGQVRGNKTYPEDRICLKCGAILSIYDKGKKCHTHTVGKYVNPVLFGNLNKGLRDYKRLS